MKVPWTKALGISFELLEGQKNAENALIVKRSRLGN